MGIMECIGNGLFTLVIIVTVVIFAPIWIPLAIIGWVSYKLGFNALV